MARLLDKGFSFAEIAAATDRQIIDIVFHPRDEAGRVEDVIEAAEEEPSGRAADYQALFGMGEALRVPEEELRATWARKYGPDDRPWEGG